ncbi:MAG: DUF222 domain-containing protein [Jiangellaceae bacterium]|nr:DUF222 domain-containing protein [Jiangellaceae bacterium]
MPRSCAPQAKTLLARRVAATHQRGSATRSAADELAHRSGNSPTETKRELETSHRLPEQRPVDGALRRGELSPAQAAAISRAVAVNPAEADRLVHLAGRVSLRELEDECARVRAAADRDPRATHRRLHQQRRVSCYTDGEGFWNLRAQGTPHAGAAFTAVLDALTDAMSNKARSEGRREPNQAHAFDALVAMADQLGCRPAADQVVDEVADADSADLDRPAPIGRDTTGTDGSDEPNRPNKPNESSGRSAPRGANRPERPTGSTGAAQPGQAVGLAGGLPLRYLALLRVDLTALRRGRVEASEMCEIRGVGAIPVSVAEELLGQAVLKLVITHGVDVRNVTHLGRGPTAAQKIALAWASPECSVEGCWRTRTQYDHREPWAQTRHTRLDELDLLCSFHHDLKTRLGWALVDGTGKRAFVPPDDPRHPDHRPECAPAGDSADGRTARHTGSDGRRPPTRPGRPHRDRPTQQAFDTLGPGDARAP